MEEQYICPEADICLDYDCYHIKSHTHDFTCESSPICPDCIVDKKLLKEVINK